MIDLRPAFLHPVDAFFDLGRGAVAHGIAHGATAHFDADLVPHAVLSLQHGHQVINREFSQEVGSPAGVGADTGLFDVQLLGLGDDLGPAFHLLHLGAVGVPADKNVAHVNTQARILVPLNGQRRRIGTGPFNAPGVQCQGGIVDARFGVELGDDLVDALHLRGPLGTHE